jgi:methyl-accepting chemotaxis protein
MVTKEDLNTALNAHMKWKVRLETAVADGKSEFKPDVVMKDDACDFGRWLYTQPADVMKSDHYKKVKALHADFHKTAGTVLQLALSGRGAEAKKALDLGGEYRSITGKLVLALNVWKDAII